MVFLRHWDCAWEQFVLLNILNKAHETPFVYAAGSLCVV